MTNLPTSTQQLRTSAERLLTIGAYFFPVNADKSPRLSSADFKKFTKQQRASAADLEKWLKLSDLYGFGEYSYINLDTGDITLTFDTEGAAMKFDKFTAFKAECFAKYPDACYETPSTGFHLRIVIAAEDTKGIGIPVRVASLIDESLPEHDPEKIQLLAEIRRQGHYTIPVAVDRAIPEQYEPARITKAEYEYLLSRLIECSKEAAEKSGKFLDTYLTDKPAKAKARRVEGDTGDALIQLVEDGLVDFLHFLKPGYRFVGKDRAGREYYQRPGTDKATSGNRLAGSYYNHSSSEPLGVGAHSLIDVLAHRYGLTHGEAATTLERAAEALIKHGVVPEAGTISESLSSDALAFIHTTRLEWIAKADERFEKRLTHIELNPAFFSHNRPELDHIHAVAKAMGCNTAAAVGATLAYVRTVIPPKIVIPSMGTPMGSLNFMSGIVGDTAAGKGAALAVAAYALDILNCPAPRELGSGQGIVKCYRRRRTPSEIKALRKELTPETDPKARKVPDLLKPLAVASGMFDKADEAIYIDPIEKLADGAIFKVAEITSFMAGTGNSGGGDSYLLGTILKFYSGEGLGAAYSDDLKNLPLGDHEYAGSLVAGIQPAKAHIIFDQEDVGLPARFLMAAVYTQTISKEELSAGLPERLKWQLPQLPYDFDPNSEELYPLTVAEIIKTTTIDIRYKSIRGEMRDNPRAGHRNFTRVKVAALLAILNGHWEINETDWELAGYLMDVHIQTEEAILSYQREARAIVRINQANNEAELSVTTAAITESAFARATAEKIWKKINTCKKADCKDRGACEKQCILDATKDKWKEHRESGLEFAQDQNWIVVEELGSAITGGRPATRYRLGAVRPAP